MKRKEEMEFEDVVKSIKDVGNKRLNSIINLCKPYWPPETRWDQLESCLNKFMPKDSENHTSVKIHAIFNGCTEKQMLKRFKEEGY